MYAVGRSFNVYNVGHFSEARPPKKSEVSSQVLKSLVTYLSSWNGSGLHDVWGLFLFVLIQIFFHLGTLATELWTSDFLEILWGGFERLSWSALLECDYSSSWLPWRPGESKRGSKEWHWFGEKGIDGWYWWLQEKEYDQEGACARQRKGRCLIWQCQCAKVSSLSLGWVQLEWVHSPWNCFRNLVDLFVLDKESAAP